MSGRAMPPAPVTWAATGRGRKGTMDGPAIRERSALPTPVQARVVATLSVVVIAATYWAAVHPGAEAAQTRFVTWINEPPQPVAAVLAVTGSLFRPVPLTVLAAILLAWIMVTCRGGARWEVVRAMATSFVIAEVVAQTLKRMADQPRPTAAIPGLDVHGYPKDPFGNAYPSAHTSVTVGLVTALWPWLTRPQRAVGVAVAVLVALNRLYIGAHWPVDVVGGAAIGLFTGSVCWLVAARWPIRQRGPAA
jgi:undecaprenyl-diphosphatase